MNQLDGLSERVTRVETQVDDIREDVRDIRKEDIRDIKDELSAIHKELTAGQRGMSRPEKMMFSGIVITAVSALVGVIALLTGGPS